MICMGRGGWGDTGIWLEDLKEGGKGKGKFYLRTGHEGPQEEWKYSSSLSLTSALDGVSGQRHAPTALLPGKRPGTHCIGGWVGPRAGLDGCGKSLRPKDSIAGPYRP